MTCRCSCKAYGGMCDCRFDGLNAGRNENAALRAEVRKVLEIIRCRCDSHWTDRNMHSPECVAYELDDLRAMLQPSEEEP